MAYWFTCSTYNRLIQKCDRARCKLHLVIIGSMYDAETQRNCMGISFLEETLSKKNSVVLDGMDSFFGHLVG